MAGENWEMPQPIFRTSVGADAVAAKSLLPDGNLQFEEPDTLTPDPVENLSTLYEPPESSPIADEPVATPDEIEEQPRISEQLTAGEVIPTLPAPIGTKKTAGSPFLSILLVLLIVLVVLLLAVYYVLVIRQPSDTTF